MVHDVGMPKSFSSPIVASTHDTGFREHRLASKPLVLGNISLLLNLRSSGSGLRSCPSASKGHRPPSTMLMPGTDAACPVGFRCVNTGQGPTRSSKWWC
eukprot:478233-Rhodomonas_salina.1